MKLIADKKTFTVELSTREIYLIANAIATAVHAMDNNSISEELRAVETQFFHMIRKETE
jgi:hypothetical protein